MDSALINLSNSPIFNGSIMLLSNIGGKFGFSLGNIVDEI